MVLLTALIQSSTKKSDDDDSAAWGYADLVPLIVGASVAIIAFSANKRSGNKHPLLRAVVAFLFHEIYICQMAIRVASGEYGIKKSADPVKRALKHSKK